MASTRRSGEAGLGLADAEPKKPGQNTLKDSFGATADARPSLNPKQCKKGVTRSRRMRWISVSISSDGREPSLESIPRHLLHLMEVAGYRTCATFKDYAFFDCSSCLCSADASLALLEQININSRYGVAKVVGTVASGLVASGISFSLQIWCIDRGGPLFVAVFQPAQTVVVAIMAAVILGDQLYTGGYDYINFIKHISQSQFSPHNAQSTKPFGHCLSFFFSRIIGSILIVFGLYFVLWGKSEEKKATEQVMEEDLRRHLLDQEKSHKQNAAVSDIP
ncbi:hypothetical protein GW17_00033153 [Ensete ventricosum]|nr:hypothetical protein GW17_00033153 [Ensete ventricosum]